MAEAKAVGVGIVIGGIEILILYVIEGTVSQVTSSQVMVVQGVGSGQVRVVVSHSITIGGIIISGHSKIGRSSKAPSNSQGSQGTPFSETQAQQSPL